MLKHTYSSSRGDTLIEVLFAITVFSLVAVGGLSIMNQGTATSQRALEITMVRQQIDAQAEALRFVNSAYVSAYQPGSPNLDYMANTTAGQWVNMVESIKDNTEASDFSLMDSKNCSIPDGSFIMDAHHAQFITSAGDKLRSAQTFSQVRYDSDNKIAYAEGIWIEAVRSGVNNTNGQGSAGYIDFHIRACWDSPGQSVPATLGTIVRLYEPRG